MKGNESGVTRARVMAVTRYVTVIDFLGFSGFVRISKLNFDSDISLGKRRGLM